ncbi:nucleotide-diphospho-sugar transferase [Protomyces lactucae-debilis]|uniref:Nucleotide-diphospho-sugar transferase n=1 Tax=Protomyces lactucae-debilis TaxID=2754530 RepID=A0A1Y2FH35_PROLT|nr:nucleotide-diphospho-sugar transferase [Protomyces lactucae-debilis]ORY82714.1 nucleotide-diphospho-sugar transferase [Protomyces lactucae-debilis]
MVRHHQRHTRRLSEMLDSPFVQGCGDPVAAAAAYPRENAAFVILARNSELDSVLHSMSSLEHHFNRWFQYPYVFLNDAAFTDAFKAGVSKGTKANVAFGQVNSSMWGFPEWADKARYREAMAQQGDRGIKYGGLESYHHMCRFFSGYFFNHELVKDLEFFWRVEPDVTFFCDLTYDPFRMMKQHGKVYGFVIALKERLNTIPTLFRHVEAWRQEHRIKETSFADYNLCHFWSNFEIARVDFFQSERYMSFFNDLDKSGGFWLERWGDAPIHTFGAALLLEAEQIHYFRDIGYQHSDIAHCPANAPSPLIWSPKEMYNTSDGTQTMDDQFDEPKQGGHGCRCKCPLDYIDLEWRGGSCMNEWAKVVGGWLK